MRAQWLSSFCIALGIELGNGSDFLVLLGLMGSHARILESLNLILNTWLFLEIRITRVLLLYRRSCCRNLRSFEFILLFIFISNLAYP